MLSRLDSPTVAGAASESRDRRQGGDRAGPTSRLTPPICQSAGHLSQSPTMLEAVNERGQRHCLTRINDYGRLQRQGLPMASRLLESEASRQSFQMSQVYLGPDRCRVVIDYPTAITTTATTSDNEDHRPACQNSDHDSWVRGEASLGSSQNCATARYSGPRPQALGPLQATHFASEWRPIAPSGVQFATVSQDARLNNDARPCKRPARPRINPRRPKPPIPTSMSSPSALPPAGWTH